jgi:uncharacterized protein YlxW (UPF0749 family)
MSPSLRRLRGPARGVTSRPAGRLAWQAAVTLLAVAVGLAVGSLARASAGATSPSARGDELAMLVEREQARVAALEARAEALSTEIADAAERAGRPLPQAPPPTPQAAGFAPVTGPGVSVTLDDADVPETLPPDLSPDDFVVHQQDVDAVMNALWAGGAVAMSVMDRRVLATSSVRCVGNVILVDGEVFSPPFVITAVGDPALLERALDADPTVARYRDWAGAIGLGYQVRSRSRVVIPAAAGAPQLTWARPDEPAAS